jgi:hypothetical protein
VSYCRFSDGDVYLYAHVGGGFECCACRLAEKVPTVFTVGCKDHPLLGDVEPCEKCNGEGCDDCMMPGSLRLQTRSECINHLQKHRDAGHKVPEYAFEYLRKEIEEEGEKNYPIFEDGYNGPVIFNISTGEMSKLLDPQEEKDDLSNL